MGGKEVNKFAKKWFENLCIYELANIGCMYLCGSHFLKIIYDANMRNKINTRNVDEVT